MSSSGHVISRGMIEDFRFVRPVQDGPALCLQNGLDEFFAGRLWRFSAGSAGVTPRLALFGLTRAVPSGLRKCSDAFFSASVASNAARRRPDAYDFRFLFYVFLLRPVK